MGYIEDSLTETEVLIGRAQFHWVYRASAWALLAASLVAAAVLIDTLFPTWMAALTVLAGLLAFLSIMLPLWTTEIGVTNQRLIIKEGVLSRHTDEIELWAIEEINLEQGVLGRIFGFGRINVQGTGDDALALPPIADPLSFRKALENAIGVSSKPAGHRPKPAS